ncbi:uncharacterized protein LOC9304851 [Arabidopsis lyrata subsp. lyrata]|uniref:uncharacterized protein LOC9304851 n=1 Tax=Arabidopsis lyrata subsp. lyrata TaxID=81972 RepID=UPI000A29B3B4|nr:uncharacterized protein LOC9304851 [Arabidopsis lyrata subsp. lyrata]|eukprot:XP_002868779.2 uncharacterized protein LOC9304851 [Arabidopsis lyrata subsp. lyrata]
MASSSLTSFPCLSSLTIKPMAALTNPPRTKTPYELKKGQNRLFHKLPSGLKMEVIEQRRSKSERENPPLVFVHGSYHAAWCWAEHWLPFFSSSGFDSYAVSLLGQGESDEPLGTVAGTLQTHANEGEKSPTSFFKVYDEASDVHLFVLFSAFVFVDYYD